MSTVTLNGITVAFDDVGAGRDTLLLVHGHPFNRSMWYPQIAAFRNSPWRVLVPDLRGYGETTVVPGKVTLDVFAADLASLLDHLGIDEVVIGGLSMGGQITMEFCRRYPQRVRGLLLAATFPQCATDAEKRDRRVLADRLIGEGMQGYAEQVLPKMLSPGSLTTLPEVRDHVTRMMLTTHPEGAAAALRGRAERPGYEDTLGSLKVPSMVIVGSEDAYTSRSDTERMRDLLSDSELIWLERIGHLPNLEAPAAFNRALKLLLERVDAARWRSSRVPALPDGQVDRRRRR